MTSHLLLLVLFAAFVSAVFALIQRDDPRDQLRLAGRMVAGFLGAAILLGWIMFFLPL